MIDRERRRNLIRALGLALALALFGATEARRAQEPRAPTPPFKPTVAPAGARYAGTQACAECHQGHVARQVRSPMGRALERVTDCEILRLYPRLSIKLGPYTYTIARDGNHSAYTVSDGKTTLTLPVRYCFGQGEAGQTYVLERDGVYYESRVSFYESTRGLDLTIGAFEKTPDSLDEAAGRQMQAVEVMDCFGCHATAAVSRGRAQLDQMAPGVTCESCHGPGAEHIEAIKAGNLTAKRIFNPGRLGPYELAQEFCGSCHRSWETVMLLGMKGIGNIRFQPYRLHLSKCYDPEDRRIGCTACHDPHAARRHEAAFYDAKCASCHRSTARPPAGQTGARLAAICRVGTKNCVSCHMPKLEMPGSHFKFTDHNIRVAAPNAPYPD